ncbi:hypothetical protein C7B80_16305 [Cyanosarcina cf. burmensis CCALA 770]|nr:hypothetical protein C7B80_16305 [Cyanosarcina cf. burmensis CCALA 770]
MKIDRILKTGCSGLILAASFGWFCMPAQADKIIQINTQITGQDGNSNTSVQQSSQTAEIDKKGIKTKLDRSGDYDYLHDSSESSRQDKHNRGNHQQTNRNDKKNTSVDRGITVYPR